MRRDPARAASAPQARTARRRRRPHVNAGRHELSSAIFCSCALPPPPPGRGVAHATQAEATDSFSSVQASQAHIPAAKGEAGAGAAGAGAAGAGAGAAASTLRTTVSPDATTDDSGASEISQGFGGKPVSMSTLAPAQPSCSLAAAKNDSIDPAPSKLPVAVPPGPRKRRRSI